MNFKVWFQSRKPWLKGGIIGVVVCLLLFLFNIYVYFPSVTSAYNGLLPNGALLLPTVTGHIFPLFSHFIVEGSPLATMFCKATELNCTNWMAKEFAAEQGMSCTPWTFEGIPGCCVEQILTPTVECTERLEIAGFFGLSLLLGIAYFVIGAVVGSLLARRKTHGRIRRK